MEMKLKFLICDDEEKYQNKIRDIVEGYMHNAGVDYEISLYSSGRDFLEQYVPSTEELIFMDIDMPDIQGSAIAEKLEKCNAVKHIIFVTGYDHLILENLHYRPFQFIRKHLMEIELPAAMEKYLLQYEEARQSITIQVRDAVRVLAVEDICYLECINHTVTIHVNSGNNISLRSSLNAWESKLPEKCFFRSHKGYLVNIGSISSVQIQDIVMKNGDKVLLSRSRREELKKRLILARR